MIPDTVEKINMQAFRNCTSLLTVQMPLALTDIFYGAFYGCRNLQYIDLPENVKYIGVFAFAECTSLQTVELPRAVVDVAAKVFYNCTNLAEVNFSKFTTSIGVQSFYGCTNLKELKLPNTVEKIDLAAFENSGLSELHCRAITPPVVNRSFGYRGKVLVPYRSLELYKQAEGWKDCALE